jgi:hypothetical protein
VDKTPVDKTPASTVRVKQPVAGLFIATSSIDWFQSCLGSGALRFGVVTRMAKRRWHRDMDIADGQTYTTRPGSRLLLAALCLPTGEIPSAPTLMRPPGERALMMPKRHRTRDQDRSYRINAERARNAAHVAARNQPPPF